MAELSEIDKIRKKRRRKIVLGRILALVLLTLLGVGVYVLKDEVNTVGFTSAIQSAFAGIRSGPGYPLEFSGEEVKGVCHAGNNLVVLTNSNLYIYNSKGKELRDVQHKYSNPVVRVAGSRVLIYDRGGRELRVESLMGTVAQKQFGYAIYAADLSGRGEVAVVTGAQRYLAELAVYDPMLTEKKFKWYSTKDYVIDAAFTSDNRGVAAVGVKALEGDLVSSVHMFRLKKEEEHSVYSLEGQLIHGIETSSKGVTAVTDRKTVLLSQEGELIQEYDYQNNALVGFDYGERGMVALLFGDLQENNAANLVVLDGRGQVAWEQELSAPQQFSLGGSRLGIVLDGRLTGFDMAGQETVASTIGSELVALEVAGSNAYLITPDTIEKVPLS